MIRSVNIFAVSHDTRVRVEFWDTDHQLGFRTVDSVAEVSDLVDFFMKGGDFKSWHPNRSASAKSSFRIARPAPK